ncbi:MAG: tetratricopeptide repeat protein [Treponema sp.]|nr:tetratricopeptide repeat protein [Treponema sp.]
MQKAQKTTEKVSTGERINEFIQNHRKPIFIIAGAVVVLLVASIAGISLADVLRANAIAAVEELGNRYADMRSAVIAEYEAVTAAQEETEEAAETTEENPIYSELAALLDDLTFFASKKSGYAGGRAWSILGIIYSDTKNWEEAETAWANAAKTARKTHLAPHALFNAGVAAEEQGKTEQAITYYSGSLSAAVDFAAAPRAQFAIGRLQESLGEDAAAIAAYQAVIANWSYDRVWVNLAHSRIIALEAK